MSRSKFKQRKPKIKPGAKEYRRMLKFWLDVVKPDERALFDYIEELKDRGEYTAAIRNGLELDKALRATEEAIKGGSPPPTNALDKLESNYPHTLRWIREEHHSKELDMLRAELSALRAIVGKVGIAPAEYKPRTSSVDAPIVNMNTGGSGKAVSNFKASLKAFKNNG